MKYSRNQDGAVLIELALTVPVLIFVLAGVLEFSKAISEYKVIVNQVRNATRYLSTKVPTLSTDQYSGIEAAKCLLKTGVPQAICGAGTGTNYILPGLATATIDVQNAATNPSTHKAQSTATTISGPSINLVTVTVTNYVYNLNFGQSILGGFGIAPQINFGPISATMRQTN